MQDSFLEQLRHIGPDLCVTAAYGNILPRAFLDIPRCGTLNIHPSLLPRWRGAAPVPRAIEVSDTFGLICQASARLLALMPGGRLLQGGINAEAAVLATCPMTLLYRRAPDRPALARPAPWVRRCAGMAASISLQRVTTV